MTKRTPKTPRQRAEEALGVEQRRVKRLTEQRDKARSRFELLEAELTGATARRDHLAKSPDLPTPSALREPRPRRTGEQAAS